MSQIQEQTNSEIVTIAPNFTGDVTVHYAKIELFPDEDCNPYEFVSPLCGTHSQYGFGTCDLDWMRTIGKGYTICQRCEKILNSARE